MTLKFSRLLEVFKVHVCVKFHQAKCSDSWVIVLSEEIGDDAEQNTAVTSAGSKNSVLKLICFSVMAMALSYVRRDCISRAAFVVFHVQLCNWRIWLCNTRSWPHVHFHCVVLFTGGLSSASKWSVAGWHFIMPSSQIWHIKGTGL